MLCRPHFVITTTHVALRLLENELKLVCLIQLLYTMYVEIGLLILKIAWQSLSITYSELKKVLNSKSDL